MVPNRLKIHKGSYRPRKKQLNGTDQNFEGRIFKTKRYENNNCNGASKQLKKRVRAEYIAEKDRWRRLKANNIKEEVSPLSLRMNHRAKRNNDESEI